MERGVTVEESLVRSDGTTEVDGGLKMPVEDPPVRAEGDNRKWRGEIKDYTASCSRSGSQIPFLQG